MTGKVDLFTPVHKGLRAMIYGLSVQLQSNDFADVDATTDLVGDLENDFATARSAGCILCAFAHHAHVEESIVFPPSAKAANALITDLIKDHHELTRRELEIATTARELLGLSSPEERIAAGIVVNQKANELFARYIVHMNREEVELVPIMREHFTDQEQLAMQGAIIRTFPPDQLMALLGWMLPALNVTELSELVGGLKQMAPPPVLKAVTDLCDARVESIRWAAVKLRVGL
jgi:phosphoglycolate phosphatase-like HAD superfamily hydrolase